MQQKDVQLAQLEDLKRSLLAERCDHLTDPQTRTDWCSCISGAL